MRYDAVIIGGSFAGLSAATYLARARRTACVIDAGRPRNRFTTHSHGFLGHDGDDPRVMLAQARSQVAAYPTVTFIDGTAENAAREQKGFTVGVSTGEVLEGTALVLAFGISDELPAIPGLEQRWGSTVLHCPYCHGYELSGRRLGVLSMSPMSAHQALLISEWGPVTFFLNGDTEPDADVLARFARRDIAIERGGVKALHGSDAVSLTAVELRDGRDVPLDALYIGPRNQLNSDIATQLGCETEELPLGTIIRADATQLTTVPGVYAAGDITRGAHTVTWASADGVMAGVAVHRSLVFGS
jgi:thioredoxin reductase